MFIRNVIPYLGLGPTSKQIKAKYKYTIVSTNRETLASYWYLKIKDEPKSKGPVILKIENQIQWHFVTVETAKT